MSGPTNTDQASTKDSARYQRGMQIFRLLADTLDREAPGSPVDQQIAIELLMASHAFRMGNPRDAVFVVTSMFKHVRQFMAEQQELDNR